MKITALVPNFAGNQFARVVPIARVLKRHHDVEFVGILRRGEGVFPPLADAFPYTVIEWDPARSFVGALREVERAIDADVVYAFQAFPFSYGAALLHRARRRVPVVLDVTDWMCWRAYERPGRVQHLVDVTGRLLGRGWGAPFSVKYAYLFHKLIPLADAVTVAATFLQRRYGGTLVRPGPDPAVFDPTRYDARALRTKWGIDPELRVIAFAGTPSPWKGVDLLLGALDRLPQKNVRLVMAGKPLPQASDRIIHLGFLPHASMPELLAMADCVVLPQRPHPMAEGQVPTKVFEAMSMTKPIVATAVGDMPELLEGCGRIVDPESVPALAAGIEWVFADAARAAEMGRRARAKCIRDYSPNALEPVLAEVFRPFSSRPLPVLAD